MNRGRFEVLEAPFFIVRGEGRNMAISKSSDKAIAAEEPSLSTWPIPPTPVVAGSIEKHESRQISPYKVKREHARGEH